MSETEDNDTPLSRGEQTRQAILDAAETLILDQGYHGTSMRQIAEAAGIAVGGIYNHFAGKEAIFAALVERHQPYSNIVARVSALPGRDADELVQTAARTIVDQAMIDPVFVRLALIDLQEFEGETLTRFANQMVEGMLAFTQRLVATGQLREDLPPPALVRAFGGLVIFYALGEILNSDDLRIPLFAQDMDWIGWMADIYLHGVLKAEE